MSSNNDAAGSRAQSAASAPPEAPTPKSKKKARNRAQPKLDEASPATPPKSQRTHPPHASAAESHTGKSQGKPKRRGNNSVHDAGSASEHSQPPAAASAATPAKPVQIYAGPTFHASPAPSSLPIPKMFSKSMPQSVDKDASLRNMLHSDVSEDSSGPEGSPTLRGSAQAMAVPAREESPLDIFFRADREEKARRQLNASQSSLVTPPSSRRAPSTSPGPGSSASSRRLPAQMADSSIFPLEMDSGPSSRATSSRLEDSPSLTRPLDARSADARAKTEALKNLLRFQGSPQPRGVASPSFPSSRSSSTPPQQVPNLERSVSEPQISMDGSASAYGPPRVNARQSSQLRQQLDQVASEHYGSHSPSSHMRSTPSPYGTPTQTSFRGPAPRNPHGASPGPALAPPGASRVGMDSGTPPPPSGQNSTEAMEAQLRRILKLNPMPSAGVQS